MFDNLNVQFEIKELTDEGAVEGYASVFDNVDQGGDIVTKSAFDKSLSSGRLPKMLWQHDPSKVIGLWTDVKKDERGLYVKGKILTDLSLGREAHILAKAGAIDGLSIGYRTIEYDRDAKGNRLLKEVELWETSLVTFPMNKEATLTSVKKLDSKRDVERILREAGVSANFAKVIAGHGFDEAKRRMDQREADEDAQMQAQELLRQLNELKGKLNAQGH